MKRVNKTCSALFLSLLVAVTSIALGTARGQARVAGQMVICSGDTSRTVSVDADGQPTGTVHICPDCAFSFVNSVGDVPAVDPVSAPVVALFFDFPGIIATGISLFSVGARGPPNPA